MPYEQRKQDLIEEITAAFDGVSREGGVSLSEAWVIDNYGSDEERAEARKEDTETRWQDVPDEDICNGASCLYFMDEIGFRYYLPAYIVWYLRFIDVPDCGSNTFDSLINALGALHSGDLDEHEILRFKLFTPEESKAIAHFLEFEQDREDAYLSEYRREYQRSRLDAGISQERIDAAWQTNEKNRIHHDLPENQARRALERCWKQFL